MLSLGVLVRAWTLSRPGGLPRRTGGWAVVLLLLAVFVLSRWLPAFTGIAAGAVVPAATADVTMYWAIFLLDLGIVVPAAIATAVGLLGGARWARTALYAVIGWFAMVPPSVAAMSVVKILRDDPLADPADTVVLSVVALVVGALAVVLYRPQLRSS
ncbi:hypothetical protein PU560_04500 [Georgenia sp. 10Sc9-8]|uniref:Histidine kinase n=1 Tax=Georgenia halotolerans TaxID=3028317 RepID=A0ABT5TUJ7_9MICO|nr:hypothetical protein [Georgenia halotolerans]